MHATANVVPSSPILVALMMEVLRSIETLVLTRVIRRNIPEECILHSYRCENLTSSIYIVVLSKLSLIFDSTSHFV
jgi:hypothetical protein